SFWRCVGEQDLLRQNSLAGAGSADHERDRISDKSPAEHLVQTGVARRNASHHEGTIAAAPRVSAFEPNKSRTVDTNCNGSSGLFKKALAPAARASSARSSADTASSG